MSENLSTAITLLFLVAAFAGLVVWVRRDNFATRAEHADVDTLETEPVSPAPVAASPIPGRRTRVLQVSAR